ncbi:MAG: hypothetical protein BJ554DRAFT_6148, partial [Olpidium bornovanus]
MAVSSISIRIDRINRTSCAAINPDTNSVSKEDVAMHFCLADHHDIGDPFPVRNAVNSEFSVCILWFELDPVFHGAPNVSEHPLHRAPMTISWCGHETGQECRGKGEVRCRKRFRSVVPSRTVGVPCRRQKPPPEQQQSTPSPFPCSITSQRNNKQTVRAHPPSAALRARRLRTASARSLERGGGSEEKG